MKKISLKINLILTIAFLIGIYFFLSNVNILGDYWSRIVTLVAIYSIMAVSYTLVNGITGIFSLGQAGFIAIGAYTSALLTLSIQQKEMSFFIQPLIWPLNSIQIGFLPATIIGGLVAAFFAFLIGYPSLRLTGDYFAIATLAFAEIIRILIQNLYGVTNGTLGLKGINPYTNVWWAWSWLLVTVIVIGSLKYSSYGRALRAISEDPVAAKVMGIDVFRHQMMAFVISGFFAGVSGALYAHWITTLDPRPTSLGVMLTFYVLIMIVIGGLGSITGAILGAIFFAFVSQWLRIFESNITIFGFTIPGVPGMSMLILSVLFIIVMIFWRRGLMGKEELNWQKIYNFFKKVEVQNE
ncbi:MAG: branched-chain amino acid ABC transporter permease [Mesoaciditoga sp.]|uniref:branched-chain amino acid ABC transporter permease n=1 Tax=Athalassotoga sp. TaxID=2022597 RepID=UPI000CBCF463|nr:MAG: branched-chain amino acid ABC transporter permease [Mesoaciditoga sp.]HEU24040.1 branched-chain amino acid ABC transporter permease [Mesoaciditoga lauensis]